MPARKRKPLITREAGSPLANPSHEAMARDVAGGMSQWAAWLAAGHDPKNRNYQRLFKRPEIIDRVAELRAEFNEAAGIHLRYLQEKLLGIATTDATEFFEPRPYSSSLRLKDPKTLAPQMRAAVSEMYIDRGGRVGIKLESKLHAIDSLLKTIGGFAPSQVEVSGPGGAPLAVLIEHLLHPDNLAKLDDGEVETLRLIAHKVAADEPAEAHVDAVSTG
jgi:hypothetical protein